jgi:hypothetical protein
MLIIGVAALLAVVIFALRVTTVPDESNSNTPTKTYSNAAYGFMLKMPADFAAYPPNYLEIRNAEWMGRVSFGSKRRRTQSERNTAIAD